MKLEFFDAAIEDSDVQTDEDANEITEWFEEAELETGEFVENVRIALKGDAYSEDIYTGFKSDYIEGEDYCLEKVDIEFTCSSGNVYLLGYDRFFDEDHEDEEEVPF